MIGFRPLELIVVLVGVVVLIGIAVHLLFGNKRKHGD
jgi:FtsZ-interacting cell division protein ZipA